MCLCEVSLQRLAKLWLADNIVQWYACFPIVGNIQPSGVLMIGLRDDEVLKLLHAYTVVSQKSLTSHFGSIFRFKVYSDKYPP